MDRCAFFLVLVIWSVISIGFVYGTMPQVQVFTFGCDILTGTYKVVEFREEKDKDNHGLLKSQGCITHVDQLVILSLDLSTETYIQFLKSSDFHAIRTVNSSGSFGPPLLFA
ncbi:transmembrane protein, putative [Medicago truncatula]|uniref:Transmembrane protein, putative n=1 Tax=Medicago truncatula TaxID=3880 RepID=A0A072UM49_MEDTR|nr:transmembrane protein, putative [Medicago truncatula]